MYEIYFKYSQLRNRRGLYARKNGGWSGNLTRLYIDPPHHYFCTYHIVTHKIDVSKIMQLLFKKRILMLNKSDRNLNRNYKKILSLKGLNSKEEERSYE